jgi:hypothetical protein
MFESPTAQLTSFLVRRNFCKESNYNSPAALSQKTKPCIMWATEKIKEDKIVVMYQF